MIYTNRILISALLFIAVTLIGACGGSNSSTIADVVEQVAQGGGGENGSATGGSTGAAAAGDSAKATVSAKSLRVRAAAWPGR